MLLLFHARRSAGFAEVNASLALQNASLMALALGVGSFYPGFVISACKAPMSPQCAGRIKGLLGIPPGNNVYVALASVYPFPKLTN